MTDSYEFRHCEWVENNWLIRTVVIVGLVYVVAAQLR